MLEHPAPVDRVLGLLGLARRAGKLALGRQAVLQAVIHDRASLIVLAGDASIRTSSEFARRSNTAGVPVITMADMELLGKSVGSSPLAVCAVCDKDFARGIASLVGVDGA